MSILTIVTPASATPSPVLGNTTVLDVLASSDSYPESVLTYTWSLTGIPPAGVSYADNGTNSAKNTTVTFFKAGTYNFLVTVEDPVFATITSPVAVIVTQTYTTVTIDTIPTTPDGRSIIIGTITSFTALTRDQFGDPMLPQPGAFTWTVTSGGPIDSSGFFTATLVGGPFQVHAQFGSHIGESNFTVIVNPLSVPPPILWDRGTLAAGVIIHVLNPAHFALNQELIKALVTPLLPAHVKVYFVFDE